MGEAPIVRLVRWVDERRARAARVRAGEHICHVCDAAGDVAAVDGYWACGPEHADDIARERSW